MPPPSFPCIPLCTLRSLTSPRHVSRNSRPDTMACNSPPRLVTLPPGRSALTSMFAGAATMEAEYCERQSQPPTARPTTTQPLLTSPITAPQPSRPCQSTSPPPLLVRTHRPLNATTETSGSNLTPHLQPACPPAASITSSPLHIQVTSRRLAPPSMVSVRGVLADMQSKAVPRLSPRPQRYLPD